MLKWLKCASCHAFLSFRNNSCLSTLFDYLSPSVSTAIRRLRFRFTFWAEYKKRDRTCISNVITYHYHIHSTENKGLSSITSLWFRFSTVARKTCDSMRISNVLIKHYCNHSIENPGLSSTQKIIPEPLKTW